MTDKERKKYLKANGIKMKYNFKGIREDGENAIIEKIRGIYIPFWLYDLNINGNIEALGKQVTQI